RLERVDRRQSGSHRAAGPLDQPAAASSRAVRRRLRRGPNCRSSMVTGSSVAAPTAEPAEHRTVIRPAAGWADIDVRELWAYRELLGFLIWRDVKVRYKQTALGVVWAIVQPVASMALFTILF